MSDRLLWEVTIPSRQWISSKNGNLTYRRKHLTIVAKVWFYFLRHSLMPTGNISSLNMEQVFLHASIVNGRSINIGKIIVNNIPACANKRSGKFFFSTLICLLCRTSGVCNNSCRWWLLSWQHHIHLWSQPHLANTINTYAMGWIPNARQHQPSTHSYLHLSLFIPKRCNVHIIWYGSINPHPDEWSPSVILAVCLRQKCCTVLLSAAATPMGRGTMAIFPTANFARHSLNMEDDGDNERGH